MLDQFKRTYKKYLDIYSNINVRSLLNNCPPLLLETTLSAQLVQNRMHVNQNRLPWVLKVCPFCPIIVSVEDRSLSIFDVGLGRENVNIRRLEVYNPG